MSNIQVLSKDLNDQVMAQYDEGDTITVIGDETLNKTGWLTLIKSGKPFNLILENGQRDFSGLKFGEASHELKILSIVAPNVQVIPNYTFRRCRYLERAEFPKARLVLPHAFEECFKLSEIILPLAEKVLYSSFNLCPELHRVSFPNVRSLGKNAFNHCLNLQEGIFPLAEEAGDYAFGGCFQLTNMVMPRLKTLGEGAFFECERLSSVQIDDVQDIGAHALRHCSSLKNLYLPKVQSIGDGAFAHSSIEMVDLPNAIKLGVGVFSDCECLTSASLMKVTTIPGETFQSCVHLHTFDAQLAKEFGASSFNECRELKIVNFPSLVKVKEFAFYGCSSLCSISMPKIKSIGREAFKLCPMLGSVILPKKVKAASSAFDKDTMILDDPPHSETDEEDIADPRCERTMGGYPYTSKVNEEITKTQGGVKNEMCT